MNGLESFPEEKTIESLSSDVEVTTVSATFEDMTDIVLTVPSGFGGSYLCMFNAVIEFTQANKEGAIIINVNDSHVADTERIFSSIGADLKSVISVIRNLLNLNGGDIVKMKFKTDGATLKILKYTFIIMRTSGV